MKEKITAFCQENLEAMLGDIAQIVAVRSVKGPAQPGAPFGPGPAQALEHMAELARRHGFEARNVDGYVLEININDREDELGILCHLDVVHEGNGWTTPPYEMDIRDGKIFGRGVADNKGPAIAALYAMKCVRELGVPLRKNVRLMLGTDEESGSADLKAYWQRRQPPRYCFSPDAAFPVYNIEKGRFAPVVSADFEPCVLLPRVESFSGGYAANVVPDTARAVILGMNARGLEGPAAEVTARTGIAFDLEEQEDGVAITAKGVSTHASYPEEGNNAITGLLGLVAALPLARWQGHDALAALAGLIPHGDFLGQAARVAMADDISGPLTLNLGTLAFADGGMSAAIDIRSPVCGTRENVALALADACAARGLGLDTTEMVLPHHVDEKLPFIQTLLKSYEEYTGLKGECVAMGGGTYVHGMKNSVAFGAAFPDTDTNAHAADEYAVIDELAACVKIFAQVIIDVCGQ